MSQYNMRNPAVKRLMREAQELLHPTDEYHAQPLEDNLFEWHFTIRGPPNSDYDGGIYHGRITLPPDYPMKPPSIILLTPNGRFETNKKICLSISGHHPESWQPSWSIRTALLAIIGFMPTHGNGALGSLDYTPEERQQLAARSKDWQCSECGYIKDIFVKKVEKPPEKEDLQESIPSSETSSPEIPYHVRPVGSAVLITQISEDASSSQHESEPVPCSEDGSSVVPNKSTRPSVVPSKDDETCLVQQKQGTQIPENSIEEKRTSDQSGNSFFFSAFVIVIMSIIAFLCLRRLFSM